MNTLIYMAHGANCYRDEAIYSILSFWRLHDPARYMLLVVTDEPDYFIRVLGPHPGVHYLPLSQRQLDTWRGPHGYVHRIKSCVVHWAMQAAGASIKDGFLFVDSDTAFTASVEPVFARIARGQVFLHQSEGTVEGTRSETNSKRRLYHAIVSQSFRVGGVERRLRTGMTLWNSGVIGLRGDQVDLLTQTIEAIDDIYPKVGINTVEQIALSAVLDIRHIAVHACDHVVLHYHVFKEFRDDLAQFFQRYAGSSLEQWLEHVPEIDPAQRIQPKLQFNARPKWHRQWLKLSGKRWQPLPYPWAH